MRRELKLCRSWRARTPFTSSKPIPDEEGTETFGRRRGGDRVRGSKPIPDEEGTETTSSYGEKEDPRGSKPIPDEEGTETLLLHVALRILPVRNRFPMRRELKHLKARFPE